MAIGIVAGHRRPDPDLRAHSNRWGLEQVRDQAPISIPWLEKQAFERRRCGNIRAFHEHFRKGLTPGFVK